MFRVSLRVRAVATAIAVAIAALGLGHFGLAHREWDGWRLFNLSVEGSFGTWFAAALGAAAGLGAWAVAARRRLDGEKYAWWLILALGMLAYSLDEVAMVHEGVAGFTDVIRDDTEHLSGQVAVLGYLLIPIFALVIWGIWRVAAPGSRGLIGFGLAGFWLFAFGIEELEHMNWMGRFSYTSGMDVARADLLITGIQEVGELVAVALIVIGILRHWALSGQRVELSSSL